jgi:hypothetical protein
MVVVAIGLLRHRVKRTLHPIDRIYLRHTQAMRRLGIERGIGEGVYDFADRIETAYPHLGSSARSIAEGYSAIRYQDSVAENVSMRGAERVEKRFAAQVSQFISLCRKSKDYKRASIARLVFR